MTSPTTIDPVPANARPVVRTGSTGNAPIWLFGAALLVGGLLLFQTLDARRMQLEMDQVRPTYSSGERISSPPPLAIPQGLQEPTAQEYPIFGTEASRVPAPAFGFRPTPPQVVTRYIERPVSPAPQSGPIITTPAPSPQPAVITVAPAGVAAGPSSDGLADERVQASRLTNSTFTVPRGTVIAAVLETALDSSRAGAARAIVSRDVMGFDGARVLIPRGSRLYGEYTADVTPGQRRALVRWQRLTRPDGVIINLDSPSADPLGRAGIKGKVDSHFFARFGSAILQSILDIGVGLATRSVADDMVIVGLPGSTQQIAGQAQQAQVQPTITVNQGASVSVFVSRDLDFSTVDR